jgi:lysozyme
MSANAPLRFRTVRRTAFALIACFYFAAVPSSAAGVSIKDLVEAGLDQSCAPFGAIVARAEGNSFSAVNQFGCAGAFQFCPPILAQYFRGTTNQFLASPRDQVNTWTRYLMAEWELAKKNGLTTLIGQLLSFDGRTITIDESAILRACQLGCGKYGKLSNYVRDRDCDAPSVKDGFGVSVCRLLVQGAGQVVSCFTGQTAAGSTPSVPAPPRSTQTSQKFPEITLSPQPSEITDESQRDETIARMARDSIVYIQFDVTDPTTGKTSSVQGTGFIIAHSGYILTASHLFRDWIKQSDVLKAQNEIRGFLKGRPGTTGQSYFTLGVIDPGQPEFGDIALLSLPQREEDYPSAPICMREASATQLGQQIEVFGFPVGQNFLPMKGALGAQDAQKRWSANVTFVSGMDGAPAYERIARPGDFEATYALRGGFVFPLDVEYDFENKRPRDNSIFGIDISHYTSVNIPLEELPSFGIKFVYMKATQGSRYRDDKFDSFWSRLEDQKIHRGAYHFLAADPKQDARSQALTFLSVLTDAGGLKDTDMPPVLDFEWDKACSGCPDRWQGQDPDKIITKVATWVDIVYRETGRMPILYTARSFTNEVLGSKVRQLLDYSMWPADFSRSSRATEKPHVPGDTVFVMWQFTESAKLNRGFDGKLDANIFYGSDEQFHHKLGMAKFTSTE